eukprot:2008279-Rhodomonas_salina.3
MSVSTQGMQKFSRSSVELPLTVEPVVIHIAQARSNNPKVGGGHARAIFAFTHRKELADRVLDFHADTADGADAADVQR